MWLTSALAVVRGIADELDLDSRMAISELRQDRLDHEVERRARHRQPHAADDLPRFGGDLHQGGAYLCDGRARSLQEAPSRFRE